MSEEKEEKKEQLSSDTKNYIVGSTAFAGFLVFIGYFKLETYYSHFGVGIYEFLDFSEIITLFLEDITKLVLILLAVVTYGLITLRTVAGIIDQSGLLHDVEQFIDRHERKVMLITTTVYAIAVVVLSCSYCKSSDNWKIFLILVLGGQVVYAIIDWISDAIKKEIMIQIALSISITWCAWLLAQEKIDDTENGKISVVLTDQKGGEMSTNATTLYLGKTSSHYIFYNTNEKKSMLVPTEEIKFVSMTGKE